MSQRLRESINLLDVKNLLAEMTAESEPEELRKIATVFSQRSAAAVALFYFVFRLHPRLYGDSGRLAVERACRIPWISAGLAWSALAVAQQSANPKRTFVEVLSNRRWAPNDAQYWSGQTLRLQHTSQQAEPMLDASAGGPEEQVKSAVLRLREAMGGIGRPLPEPESREPQTSPAPGPWPPRGAYAAAVREGAW